MKIWDKVILTDLKYSEFQDLTDEMKETYEMDFDEQGIILNVIVDNMAVVAFPRGVDTINIMYLEVVNEEEKNVVYSVRYKKEGLDEFELFWLEEDALEFEKGNIEGNYETEVNLEVIR